MPENQNIEWKESWRDEYLKWICGFANAKGGKIIIGKNDNGDIVGVAKAKRLMEDIPNKIQTQLGIICDVDLKDYDGKDYIEIDVKPYDVLISYQGKYHYRSGSTKQELKGNALNKLLLKKAGKTWDDVVEPRAKFDDIDTLAIEAFKKGATTSKRLPFIADEEDIEQILDNLLLLEDGNLKRSAILLFGKNPCRFFINAFVKIGRFGQTDDDLRFQEVIEGNAFQLADKTLEVLDRKFFVSPISYKGLQRVESWEYPYEAIRECKKAGLPEPIIEYSSGGISVTILKNQFNEKNLIAKGLSARQIKAIEFIKENKSITNKIYQEICEVSKATATRDLTELIEKFKILERSGEVGAGTSYKLIGS